MAVLLLAMSLGAAPAAAMDIPTSGQAELARGKPYVDVRSDGRGDAGVIRAAIDIAAPQRVVFALVSDCGLATRMAANLKSCRILDRDPQGRWDVRELVSRPTLFRSVRSVFRNDFEPPHRIAFQNAGGGDLKVFEGEWRLAPRGDTVRVTYEARVGAPFSVPGWLARLALRQEVPRALLALRREALARAQQQASIPLAGQPGPSTP